MSSSRYATTPSGECSRNIEAICAGDRPAELITISDLLFSRRQVMAFSGTLSSTSQMISHRPAAASALRSAEGAATEDRVQQRAPGHQQCGRIHRYHAKALPDVSPKTQGTGDPERFGRKASTWWRRLDLRIVVSTGITGLTKWIGDAPATASEGSPDAATDSDLTASPIRIASIQSSGARLADRHRSESSFR